MLRGYLESGKGSADISAVTEICLAFGSVSFGNILNWVCPVFKVAPIVLMSSSSRTVCCVRLACRQDALLNLACVGRLTKLLS